MNEEIKTYIPNDNFENSLIIGDRCRGETTL